MKLQITIEGKSYEVDVEILEDDGSPRAPNNDPDQASSQSFAAPGAQAHALVNEEDEGEEKLCRSPLMGRVIRINVEPGQAIQADDLMMVLEAMKMETNVTAPVAGTVKSIKVLPGDAVKLNQVIVEFQ